MMEGFSSTAQTKQTINDNEEEPAESDSDLRFSHDTERTEQRGGLEVLRRLLTLGRA